MRVPNRQTQEAVRRTAREFATEELEPIYRKWNGRGTFPYKKLEDMAEAGLRGIMVPEEYGGVGMGLLNQAIAIEEVSKVWPSAGIKMDEGLLRYLRKFGSREQKDRYLPDLCAGELVDAIALSEPDGGSDFAGIKTTADRTDGGYVLNGTKTWVTNGAAADIIGIAAKTEQGESHRGISLFLVAPETMDGCEVGPPIEMMGFDASKCTEIRLENCFVPEENLLGEENEGFYHTMEMLAENRVAVAARAMGIAAGALDHATSYATDRTQFDQPIAEFQAIRHKVADMAVQVENARNLVYNAAQLCDEGERFETKASMAKLYAAEAAHDVASEAIQIHGANGYTKDYPVQMYFRDAKGIEIYEGTSEIQRNIIAKDYLE